MAVTIAFPVTSRPMGTPTVTEDSGPVPRQVPLVRAVQTTDLQRSIEVKGRPGHWSGRASEITTMPFLCDRDEAGVERRIEVRGEQQAVKDVEALCIRIAVGPGLDVARTQELGHVETGDRAAAIPSTPASRDGRCPGRLAGPPGARPPSSAADLRSWPRRRAAARPAGCARAGTHGVARRSSTAPTDA